MRRGKLCGLCGTRILRVVDGRDARATFTGHRKTLRSRKLFGVQSARFQVPLAYWTLHPLF